MSPMDDTNPNRGRPVLKRVESGEAIEVGRNHRLWIFCGEYEGSESRAADAASATEGPGIYKVFPSGSWPGGYLRD